MPRALAERLLLDLVAERILRNEHWVEEIYQQMLRSWRDRCAHSPGEAESARLEVHQLDQKIQRLVDLAENASDPDPALLTRLVERRRERTAAARRLESLEATVASNPEEPTREFVREHLAQLCEVLTSAAPMANTALRLLLNAPIVVRTVTRPGRDRPYWQGTVTVTTSQVITAVTAPDATGQTGKHLETASAAHEEVSLDFVRPLAIDQQVVRAWELLQQRQPLKAIAVTLGVKPARMTAIMKIVVERYGNGLTARQLRAQYRAVCTKPKAVEAFIGRVMELLAEGKLIGEIAKELGTHAGMITKAIRAGYAARGLTPPDGRTRRKTLTFKGHSSWASRCANRQSSHPVRDSD